MPAKSTQGMTVIKRAEENGENECQTGACQKKLIKFDKSGTNPQHKFTRKSQLAILWFTLYSTAACWTSS
jgi:hypothetical protein